MSDKSARIVALIPHSSFCLAHTGSGVKICSPYTSGPLKKSSLLSLKNIYILGPKSTAYVHNITIKLTSNYNPNLI